MRRGRSWVVLYTELVAFYGVSPALSMNDVLLHDKEDETWDSDWILAAVAIPSVAYPFEPRSIPKTSDEQGWSTSCGRGSTVSMEDKQILIVCFIPHPGDRSCRKSRRRLCYSLIGPSQDHWSRDINELMLGLFEVCCCIRPSTPSMP